MSVNLTSIFYPTSSSKVTDPDTAATLFAEQYSQSPGSTWILNFVDVIFESAITKPEDADSLLQTTVVMYRNESLPTYCDDRYGFTHSFGESCNIGFLMKIEFCLFISETSEPSDFLNGSFMAGRVFGMQSVINRKIFGAVAEGLRFPGAMRHNFTGELAEIMTLGACLQLLGSATRMIQYTAKGSLERFIGSLEGIEMNALDRPLVELTIRHLKSTPLRDLSSGEIVQSACSVGWNRLWDNAGRSSIGTSPVIYPTQPNSYSDAVILLHI